MAQKEALDILHQFIRWLRNIYLPSWKQNAVVLIKQLRSFESIKKEVAVFEQTTDRNIRAFEGVLARLERAGFETEAFETDESRDKIETGIIQLNDLIALRVRESTKLKVTCEYKDVHVQDIFNNNAALYQQLNAHFWHYNRMLFRNIRRKSIFSAVHAYGKKVLRSFKKPRLKKILALGEKTIDVGIFYSPAFDMEKGAVEYAGIKGKTTREFINIFCKQILERPYEQYKKRAEEILKKSNNEIFTEFAQMFLENLIAVLHLHPYLIKAQHAHISIFIGKYSHPASFYGQFSSFNTLYFTVNFLDYVGFYCYFGHKGVISFVRNDNPFIAFVHELSHASDQTKLQYSAEIETRTHLLIGKHFTPQAYLVVRFLSLLRTEGFARFNEYFAHFQQGTTTIWFIPYISRLVPSYSSSSLSYAASIDATRESIQKLASQKTSEINKYYEKELSSRHYDVGFYMCSILLIEFIRREQKELIILTKKQLELYASWEKKQSQKQGAVLFQQYIERTNTKEVLSHASITQLRLRKIGKELVKQELFIVKPSWNIVYPFIVKISLMNFIDFFKAYEKACENLGIPYTYRLSAIAEIKKAQEVSKKLNDELAKKEGFLP